MRAEICDRDRQPARGPGAEAAQGDPGRGQGRVRLRGPDGTLIPVDRVAAGQPVCSGRHRKRSGLPGKQLREDPVPGKNKPEPQKDASRAHARLRSPPGKGRTPSWRPGASCRSSAAVPGAPGSSPGSSTCCRPARHNQDGKGSRPHEHLHVRAP